jgi:hypothetical protein
LGLLCFLNPFRPQMVDKARVSIMVWTMGMTRTFGFLARPASVARIIRLPLGIRSPSYL